MTKRYWGVVAIAADRPLKVVADELNVLLAPQRLIETDRFDEVPGYLANTEGLEFSLQGPPAGADDEGYYYFDFLCEMAGLCSLPRSLSSLPVEAEPETNSEPRRRASAFLCAKLSAGTTLACTAE
jgi:hypothetical protein